MNGQSYNRYSYVMNNPTNFTDPTGFATCTGSRIEGVDTGACSPTAYATLTTDGKSVNYHSNKEDQSAAVKSGERALVYNKVNGKLMLPTGTGSANTGTHSVAENGGFFQKVKNAIVGKDFSGNTFEQNAALCQGGALGACSAGVPQGRAIHLDSPWAQIPDMGQSLKDLSKISAVGGGLGGAQWYLAR